MTENKNISAREKLVQIKEWLSTIFVERNEVAEGVLTALLAQGHVLLIGQPGTAKSLMARAICSCIRDARYFERLLTKFSVPDELFGAVKLSALKKDKFERNIEGHLPTAHIAFIDEIFKANSSILNSLLSVINERIFYNNGTPVKCPLLSVIGASNELPQDENLSALYDRFILRYIVNYIRDDSEFIKMFDNQDIVSKATDPPVQITFDELRQMQAEIDKVAISDKIKEVLVKIRQTLNKEGIIVSDRRYFQCARVLKAYAYLNGHTTVTDDDMQILQHVIWSEPQHIGKVSNIIISLTNPYGREADEIFDAVVSAMRDLQKADDKDKTVMATEILAKTKDASNKLQNIREKLASEGRDIRKVEVYIAEVQKIIRQLLKDYLGITA